MIVALALAGFKPRLMVTDPPYGVSYDPTWRDDPRLKAFTGGKRAKVASGKVMNDDRADWTDAWACFPGDVAYVWHATLQAARVERSLNDAGFFLREQIVWDKGRLIISRGHYHWRHECCFYAVRKGATAGWTGDRRQTTVWLEPHRRNASGHAAEKPLNCMLKPILNHSLAGDAVYDPFVGSGTTIMAAEQSGRVALAIELSPDHCALGDRAVRGGDRRQGDARARMRGMARLRMLRPRLANADLAIAKIPDKRADPFYLSAEWKALRDACLQRDRFRCTIAGCDRPARVADHIVSRKAGGADALMNLRSLCRTHDNRLRERAFEARRRVGV
jgi:hypothetical protein